MKLPNRNVDKNEIKRLQSPCRHYVRKNISKVRLLIVGNKRAVYSRIGVSWFRGCQTEKISGPKTFQKKPQVCKFDVPIELVLKVMKFQQKMVASFFHTTNEKEIS